ncbi:cyclase family protein [Dactylosporangium sp. AC04546]|uniref:cyclase family protein n=1 Tax=Dactylosporangium sp. AC04546 TaxID=2862460 RepID=UPI001EDCEE8B|nr:cyclase family protein [Dactylosporangium sp. AC04546]WVK80865.1 cyclase family protein [Dactylosporangium sp. AC04546]
MFVELSHEIVAGMLTRADVPSPHLTVAVPRAGTGASFEIESLTLVGNTGTYLDAPYHHHADRADLAGLPLERLLSVPIAVVRAVGLEAVTAAHLGEPDRLWGHAVLVHTGWARHWGTPRYLNLDCPHLTTSAADALVDANVALVGIDSAYLDDPADPARAVHARLLGADIPIIENLTNLDAVPDTGSRLTALPAPVRAMASFPVRAVAVV